MPEIIEFDGLKFYRYPESKNRTLRVYYNSTACRLRYGVRRLHEYLWFINYGNIPKGCYIHHKDGDPLNNNISNLECVSPKRHNTIHLKGISRPFSAKALIESAKWHKTDAGKLWHSQHAREQGFGRGEPKTYKCQNCGIEYQTTKQSNNKYCSNACRSSARRKRGADNIERICGGCSKPFTVNKYSKARCCSKQCGGIFRRKKRESI